jgi:plastocyanin
VRRTPLAALCVVVLGGAAASAAPPADAPKSPAASVRGTIRVTAAPTGAGAVVTLRALGQKPPPPADVTIDQRQLRFLPKVTVVPLGSRVRFLNSDNEAHNVYSPEGRYNLGVWAPGDAREHVFKELGAFSQLCSLHPAMLAYVVVVDTRYFAVTDAEGGFVLRDVPPGRYKLAVWHEKSDGLERDVELVAGQTLTLELVLER